MLIQVLIHLAVKIIPLSGCYLVPHLTGLETGEQPSKVKQSQASNPDIKAPPHAPYQGDLCSLVGAELWLSLGAKT